MVMKRAVLMAVGCVVAASCMKPAEPAAPANVTESGLDPRSFNREVRPQDDLFQHVNGGWLASTEIPADKASYGAFDILFDKAQEDLRAIVEESAKSANR